jgi:hypothetical protein
MSDIMDATLTGDSPQAAISLLLEIHLVMMWSVPDDPILRKELSPFLNILKVAKEREEKVKSLESTLATARAQPETGTWGCSSSNPPMEVIVVYALTAGLAWNLN